MRKFTILVDMDETLTELVGTWVEALNEACGTNVKREEITDWEMTEFFPELTKKELYSPLEKPLFWDKIKPLPGAVKNLKKLKSDGHRIVVVTASHYKTLANKLPAALFRYFDFLDFKDVVVTSQKQLIKGDYLVDDAIHNLIGGEYKGILMDATHNRDFDNKKYNIYRVKGWDELYDKISSDAKEAVVIYTSDACPLCTVLKKKLDGKNIEYREIQSLEEMTRLGITHVPMLDYGEGIVDYESAIGWVNNN